MERLSVLGTLASASIRSEFQYRANAITSILGGILYQITGFIVVWIVVARFNDLGGWGLPEITFLYGMRLTSHGIFYACFSQLFEADRVMINGEYDRFLVRPMPPLVQLFTRKLRINAFGDLIGGTALLVAASLSSAVDWSPLAVLFLLGAVVGGALVEGAVQVALGVALVPVPADDVGADNGERGLQRLRQLSVQHLPVGAALPADLCAAGRVRGLPAGDGAARPHGLAARFAGPGVGHAACRGHPVPACAPYLERAEPPLPEQRELIPTPRQSEEKAAMKDYGRHSFWLEHSGDELTPRPALDGSIDVDVAILGAGYTGLWTAFYLLERDPSLRVAIIEAEIAGFGASGRNGGWCFSGFPVPPAELLKAYGYDTARLIMQEMYRSVDEVGRVTREHGIDAHYQKGGEMEVARAAYDLPKLEEKLAGYRALGLEDHYRVLDADETRGRVNVANAVGGFLNREGAVIQPARLVRGLARAVERMGATIYEGTRVTDFTQGPRPSLQTERGTVNTRAVVLAGEAYLSRLPKLHRRVIPMTSHMVVTEPLDKATWDQIGWRNRELLGGWGTQAGYINHTADGRIAFGAYRPNYPFRSRITDAIDVNPNVSAHARASALAWFPALEGVRFTHEWGGVFGVPRDRMPAMTYDPATGIAAAYGYTGQGVATANLAGRVLADLITERHTPLTTLPMTRGDQRDWEPEPFRWMGVTFVRKSRVRLLKDVERKGAYPKRKTLAQRIYDY